VVEPLKTGYPLVAIVGPTAAGKSDLALRLAEEFDGELVNYDSVQIFRGFDVGSGKVPLEARRGIPHHLLDHLDPAVTFTAGDYRREALKVLEDVRRRDHLPILVGGTGLYLRSLLLGLFEGPARSEELRARLHRISARRGREFLHRFLHRLDPPTAQRIQPRDTSKIIRAIEVCVLAGVPMSRMLAGGRTGLEGFQILRIGLEPGREALRQRIDRRVEWMFVNGLVEETRVMLCRRDAASLKPLGALGYKQAALYLRGQLPKDQAIVETQACTRRYAKRQLIWFRREPGVNWLKGFGDDPQVQKLAIEYLEKVRVRGR
jgi:tRNA dimethylallyltransferase